MPLSVGPGVHLVEGLPGMREVQASILSAAKEKSTSVSVCFPEGVILSAIVSTDPQKLPFLLILDAKSFTELARASVAVEMHLDLHGLFIPDTDWAARNRAASEAQQDPASDCLGPRGPDRAGGRGLPWRDAQD